MRIVLVCLETDVKSLARGYRALSLAKYLGRAGHHIDLVSSGSKYFIRKKPFGRLIGVPFLRPREGGKFSAMHRLIDRLVYWPDPARKWVAPVMKRLGEIFHEAKPDVILVSSPPHSIQLIGILSARKYGVPYIADLRDDWITNYHLRWHTPIHKHVASYYEKTMVEAAACVVLNTHIVEERFRKRYPEHGPKLATVTNGYDEQDFAEPFGIDLKHDGRKSIVYTGGMYGDFLYVQFTQLVERLKLAGLNNEWRLVTAGPAPPLLPEQKDVWTHLGLLPPEAVATLLKQGNLLLAVMPPGEQTPSGRVLLKIYPYLRSGKPIVYFGETGATTDILSGFPGTFVKQRAEWPHFVKWLQVAELGEVHIRTGIQKYSFQNLAAKLAALLEDVTA